MNQIRNDKFDLILPEVMRENNIDIAKLESCLRNHLNQVAPRVMGVLNPLKVVIENYPEDQVEQLEAPNHPQDDTMGSRPIPFSREVYIDQEDFRESANKKFKRLVAGGEVRLRNAYVIRCDEVIKDENGEITEPLREGNLIGNGPKVLADIDMLGNDFKMGNPGTCGKDGQGVPVGDGQPTMRVAALTIGGTAA